MTVQQQPRPARTLSFFISHLFYLIGAVLFAVAALDVGLKWSTPYLALAFGGFAAWMLAYLFTY